MKIVPVIIPVYNLSWMTINLLISLKRCSFYEILPIVVDNASEESEFNKVSTFVVDNFAKFHIVRNESNLGFVKAVNQGIDIVLKRKYPFFFILNNDTLVTSNWDKKLVESLSKCNVAIVGPMTSPPNWRDVPSSQNIIENKLGYGELRDGLENLSNNLELIFKDEEDGSAEKVVDFLAFYCVGIKTSVVRRIGKLDEIYDMGLFDDDDYCHNVLINGYEIILRRDTYVHHYHRSTWIFKGDDYKDLLEKNRKVFISKWGFDPWDRLNNEKK
jgi:GT2 family glycosyltransferase